MTAIVIRGIRLTANFQWVMVAIEYFLVLGFAVLAFIKIASLHPTGSQAVQLWWFNPFSLQVVRVVLGQQDGACDALRTFVHSPHRI